MVIGKLSCKPAERCTFPRCPSFPLPFPSCPQLLLLFFGFIETERPSDWVLRRLGLATGQPVDAIDYRAPAPLVAGTVAVFVASGLGLAWALQALLGDATWSVSTGGCGCGRVGVCWPVVAHGLGRCEQACRSTHWMRCQVPDATCGPSTAPDVPPSPHTQAWAACLRRACMRSGAPAA